MGDPCCLWFALREFCEEGFDLGFQFGDAIGVRLDGFGRLIGYGDEILVRHLGVPEDLAAVFAGDAEEVFGTSPDEVVMVGVGHRV